MSSPPLAMYKAPPLYDKFTVTITASGISNLSSDGLVELRAQVSVALVPCEDLRRPTSGLTMPPPPPPPSSLSTAQESRTRIENIALKKDA